MSNAIIQAVACTIRPESALRSLALFGLPFPEEWFGPLNQLQEEQSGRPDKPNSIPIRSLNDSLRTFVQYLLTVPQVSRPAGSRWQQDEEPGRDRPEEFRPWLLAKHEIPTEQLWRVIQAWLEQTYSTCESFPEIQPLLRQSDLQWEPLYLQLNRGTSHNQTAKFSSLLYKAIPALLANQLVEREIVFPVGQSSRRLVRVPTEEGAELMTWPPVFVLKKEKKWGFSYTVKITMQTIPGQPEPRIHFHYGVRRWKSDSCYDDTDQKLFLKGNVSVYLRTTRPWHTFDTPDSFTIAHLKVQREGEQRVPAWTNLIPQIAKRLGVVVPMAEQLAHQPKVWLDGRDGVEIAMVDATPRYHPIGTGIGPDVCEQFTQHIMEGLSTDLILLPILTPYNIPSKVKAHPLMNDITEIPAEERLQGLVTSVGSEVTIEVFWQTEAVRDMLVDRIFALLMRPRPSLIDEEPTETQELEALLKTAGDEDMEEDEANNADDLLGSNQEPEIQDTPGQPYRRKSRKRAPEPPPAIAQEVEIISLPQGGRLRILTHPLGRLGSPLRLLGSQKKVEILAGINQRANEVAELLEPIHEPTLTLIELPNYRDAEVRKHLRGRDPKQALRLGMAKRGRVTQFITNKVDESLRERSRSAVLDGLRQLGYLPIPIEYATKHLALPSSLLVAGIWFIRITKRRAAVGVHLPVVVFLNTNQQKIYVWLPHDQKIRLYRDALLEITMLNPEQVKKRKRQEALAQLRQFILGGLMEQGTEDIVAFASAQNARSTWQGLANSVVPFDAFRFEEDGNSPDVNVEKLPKRIRFVRLRTSSRGETPEWFIPGAKPSATAQGLWVEDPGNGEARTDRLFYNIASKPKTAPKGYQGKQQNPRETYRISSIVETMPLVIQRTDDPATWAVASDQWRRMSILTNDMTLFPLPLELAHKMSEYAEVIGPWIFPEEWTDEEDTEEEGDDRVMQQE